MKRVPITLKNLLIIAISSLLLAAAGIGALGLLLSWEAQPYQEAERKVPDVYEIIYALDKRQRDGKPKPKSLDELLSLIPEKNREQLHGYQMRWHPEAEIIFVMKVNEDFGFTLNNERYLNWLWGKERVNLYFPEPNK